LPNKASFGSKNQLEVNEAIKLNEVISRKKLYKALMLSKIIKLRCARCGENHKEDQCTSLSRKCINCGGLHSSFYKGCPVYKEELAKLLSKKEENKSESVIIPSAMTQVETGQLNLVGAWKNSSELSSISAKLLEQAKEIQKNSSEIESLSIKVSSLITSQDENKNALLEHGKSILDILQTLDALNTSVTKCSSTSASAIQAVKNSLPRNLLMSLSIISTVFPDIQITNENLLKMVSSNYLNIYNEPLNVAEIKKFLCYKDGKQN
jgi:hypothetical protein